MIVETERLLLRRPEPSDLSAWCALRRESASHLLPWEPAPTPGEDPCGPHAFERFLVSSSSERHLKTLAFLSDSGDLVGWADYRRAGGRTGLHLVPGASDLQAG